MAGLGVAGVAVAFAMQSTLGNIFGGISLILDKSVKVGDVIKVDQLEDAYGEVVDVGLRSTKIKTWNNELVVIPNGKLADSRIKNYVLPDKRIRIDVLFSVAYGSDVDNVEKVVISEIHKLDNVLKEPEPVVAFMEMTPSALSFKAQVWINNYKDNFETKRKLTKIIYNALNKHKISIPFPQMDVHIKERK